MPPALDGSMLPSYCAGWVHTWPLLCLAQAAEHALVMSERCLASALPGLQCECLPRLSCKLLAPLPCSWRRYSRGCWTWAQRWPRRGPPPLITSFRLAGQWHCLVGWRLRPFVVLRCRRTVDLQPVWPLSCILYTTTPAAHRLQQCTYRAAGGLD